MNDIDTGRLIDSIELALRHAEWNGEWSYPYKSENYQSWVFHIHLPVPKSAEDKSAKAAFLRAYAKRGAAYEDGAA